jgi:hypothetical protein
MHTQIVVRRVVETVTTKILYLLLGKVFFIDVGVECEYDTQIA